MGRESVHRREEATGLREIYPSKMVNGVAETVIGSVGPRGWPNTDSSQKSVD